MQSGFKSWLREFGQYSRYALVHDLAQDVASDPGFPEVDDFDKLVEYLDAHEASVGVRYALELAWEEYQSKVKELEGTNGKEEAMPDEGEA